MFMQAYSKKEIKKRNVKKTKQYKDLKEINELFEKHKPLVYLTDKDGVRRDK
ncbi:hypothetical protein [Macrococcus capreoli]|uniref:hypothetical protein n=1 Tax=Macrococcus capreoli TaxID=2982690 RepID=UPI003EE7C149